MHATLSLVNSKGITLFNELPRLYRHCQPDISLCAFSMSVQYFGQLSSILGLGYRDFMPFSGREGGVPATEVDGWGEAMEAGEDILDE